MRYFSVLTVLACFVNPAMAEDEKAPDWDAQTLTGDWGGTRSGLYDKGINLEFIHKGDVLGNLSGGIRRGAAWMGHTEARIDMDMEKLAGWEAASAFVHYHSQLGSKFNANYAGSFAGADNIETGVNTAQFYHAWLQKNFYSNRFSVLAGLYAIDSEFYVTDTSGVFIQPPYGIASEIAQSGQNGPPIFPIGALAVRLKYTSPGENFYLQGALTDGVPGDPNNQSGTHTKLGNGDGTLSIMEFGYTPKEGEPPVAEVSSGELAESEIKVHGEHVSFNKTAIGFWRYTAQFDDLSDVDFAGNPLRRSSRGAYWLAERTLRAEKNDPSHGLSGFIRFGMASKDIHQSDWSGSLGLRYHGLIAGRGDDIAGIAVTVHHASDKYRALNNSTSSETALEATYHAQIKPWLALQPTLQYIRHPNMDRALRDVWIAGVRAEIYF